MDDESRRGFLKTLGKLATAVGITSAAATLTSKAKSPTTPKAKDFTYKTASITPFNDIDPTGSVQKTIDTLENLRLDNITAQIHPSVFYGPSRMVNELRYRSALAKLDPFNWGAVFTLKWIDWCAKPEGWSYRGGWKAYVRPEFQCLFKDHIYTQSVELPLDYLRQRVQRDEGVKTHLKGRTYCALVESLKDIIQRRIDQNA